MNITILHMTLVQKNRAADDRKFERFKVGVCCKTPNKLILPARQNYPDVRQLSPLIPNVTQHRGDM